MSNKIIETASTNELIKIVNTYKSYLPISTFPYVVLCLASIAQFFAWFGGRYLFPNSGLYSRIIYLWFIALIEFIILIPGIGASAEVLGNSESQLAIIFHAYQLIIFYILNKYTLKSEFTDNHMYAFILMISSVYIASRDN
jgi:uncharacterized protein (DUF486 family)